MLFKPVCLGTHTSVLRKVQAGYGWWRSGWNRCRDRVGAETPILEQKAHQKRQYYATSTLVITTALIISYGAREEFTVEKIDSVIMMRSQKGAER